MLFVHCIFRDICFSGITKWSYFFLEYNVYFFCYHKVAFFIVRTRPHQIINTGDHLLFMLRVREIVEELGVFERNEVPFIG